MTRWMLPLACALTLAACSSGPSRPDSSYGTTYGPNSTSSSGTSTGASSGTLGPGRIQSERAPAAGGSTGSSAGTPGSTAPSK